MIDDQIKAGVAKPELAADLFVFSHDTMHSVPFRRLQRSWKERPCLREIDRLAASEPESNADGSMAPYG